MRKSKVIITYALCALLSPSVVQAQIVNVQSALATETKEGFSGSVSGSVDWLDGNVERLALGAAPVFRYRRADSLFIAIGQGNYASNANGRYIARTFEHLRFRRTITDEWLVESFLQHTYDEFKRLNTRGLAGLGAALRPIHTDDLRLTFGAAYMFELEKLRNDQQIDAGMLSYFHRASMYSLIAARLDSKVQFVQSVYYQPRFDAPSDWRILSESQIAVPITSNLSQSTSFSIAYDSRPPAAIKNRDIALTSSVTLSY